MRQLLLIWMFTVFADVYGATSADSLRHVGWTFMAGPAWQIAMDEYEQKWLHGKRAFSIGGEINYSALPNDSDAFAQDYGYPTLSVGAKLSLNNGVTMRRVADEAWGKAQMVDYDSHLGDILSVYGAFARPLLRSGRWRIDYVLRAGIGYGPHKYNTHNNIDNELIGSRFTIYMGGGVVASWLFADEWSIKAGLLYGHHSNGALNRPNKGENHVGPMVGLSYTPYERVQRKQVQADTQPFHRYWYGNVRLGFGGKTLLEDWHLTQFGTEPGAPRYRTDKFCLYAAYSAQMDLMYRYARRWASGIGVDVFYGSYYKRVRKLDEAAGNNVSHSPWSVGIAARHEAYYHRLSVDMAVGLYLFRQMGYNAKEIEKPYYERIGLFYTFPKMNHIKLGCSVKAHLTKADYTELIVSVPFRIGR